MINLRGKKILIMSCILLLCGGLSGLVTYLFFSPTVAKYFVRLTASGEAVARGYYFSSNVLSTGDGTNIEVSAWQGKEYVFSLNLRNYDNVLLYNEEGQDVNYTIDVMIEEGEELCGAGDYSVTITKGGDPVNGDDIHTLTGEEGERKSDTFLIKVSSLLEDNGEIVPLPTGSRLSFRIIAQNSLDDMYHIRLSAAITLNVAEFSDFIKDQYVHYTPGDPVLLFGLTTTEILDGSSSNTKTVRIGWDRDYLRANEFNDIIFNIKSANAAGDFTLGTYNAAEGWLELEMRGFSGIELEFIVLAELVPDQDDSYNDYIFAEVVEEAN